MKPEKVRIVLADDDPDILEFLSFNLKNEGYTVFTSKNGTEAIALAEQHLPHLIILDIMMPGKNGFLTCKEIKQNSNLASSIVIFLTAKAEDHSQLEGFESGADDYITKPIKPQIFMSRIKALLKRQKHTSLPADKNTLIEIGKLFIDKSKFKVTFNEVPIILSKKEFKLLYLLASKPDHMFERDEIYSKVWGDDVVVGDRTIDVHIRKIREKIPEIPIQTIKGVGYKFSL